jgi:hypothetical protein
MIDVLDIVAVTLPSLGKIERCTSPHSLSHGTCGGVSHLSTTDRAAGCMQRVLEPFMSRMEVVPLSNSPAQRSVERNLGACKRLARCTAYRWRIHTIAVHSRHRATSTPREARSAGVSLRYASSPTVCNTPLHPYWAAKSRNRLIRSAM